MSKLRRIARDKDCQIRLPGICSGDSSTVVLCHFRLSGLSGLGLKPPDWLGAWGCAACHRTVDSTKDPEVQLAFAHAVFRTIYLAGAVK